MPQVSPEKIFESLLAAASQPLQTFAEPPVIEEPKNYTIHPEERGELAAMLRELNRAAQELTVGRDRILSALREQIHLEAFLQTSPKGQLIVTGATQVLEYGEGGTARVQMGIDSNGVNISVEEDGLSDEAYKLKVDPYVPKVVAIERADKRVGASWCYDPNRGKTFYNCAYSVQDWDVCPYISSGDVISPAVELPRLGLQPDPSLAGLGSSWKRIPCNTETSDQEKWLPYPSTYAGRAKLANLGSTWNVPRWLKRLFETQ